MQAPTYIVLIGLYCVFIQVGCKRTLYDSNNEGNMRTDVSDRSLFVKRDVDILNYYLEKGDAEESDTHYTRDVDLRFLHQPSLRESMTQFSDYIAPSDAIMKSASRALISLEKIIRTYYTKVYLIDRIVLEGSFAKGTGLGCKVDLDIEYYLNDCDPPFQAEVEELFQVIKQHIDSSCSRTFLNIEFKMDGIFQIDLLPAKNMIPEGHADQNPRLQHAYSLELIQQMDDPYKMSRLYSTTLSIAAVEFVKSKSDFARSLARLAKFWNKSIFLEEFHYGRSSIVEYLALRSAELLDPSEEYILHGFYTFLEMLQDAENLNVYWTEFYTEEDIPEEVKSQRPLLLDPTSPYNNMLNGKNKANIVKMAMFAEVTLDRLKKTKDSLPDFYDIFRPQPEFASFVWPRKTPYNCRTLISNGTLLQSNHKNFVGIHRFDMDALENSVLIIADAVSFTSRHDGPQEIVKRIREEIETFFVTKQEISPTFWDLSVDTRQVEIEFPVPLVPGVIISVGFNWK